MNTAAEEYVKYNCQCLLTEGLNITSGMQKSAADDFKMHLQEAFQGSPVKMRTLIKKEASFATEFRSFVPSYDSSGVCNGVIFSVNDSKESDPFFMEIEKSEFKNQIMENVANTGSWEWNLETGEKNMDNNWWAMIGYTPGEIPFSKEFRYKIYHPDDIQTVYLKLKNAISGDLTHYEAECRLMHKDGYLVPVLTRGYITRNEAGSAIRVSGINIEITDRKKAQAHLESTENYLRTIFQNTETGYIFIDSSFNILSYNQKAFEIALWLNQREISIDHNILDFVRPEHYESFAAKLVDVRKGQKIGYERNTRLPNLEEAWFYIKLAPVFNLENVVVNIIITLEDITDRKKSELQLNKSFDLVTAQNKRLLNFSYIVSHNLRSHASNITSIVDFLSEADTLEERNEMIAHLKTVSLSLDETLNNLNDIISINTSINLIFEPLLLNAFIKRSIDVLSDQIVRKNAWIVNKVSNEIVINYNPAYIESIILNFLSNAIKYSHPDRQPEVIIDCVEEHGKKVLIFQDNGIGIDLKKNGEKLFGLYKTFNGNADARGIGLFITKNQVEYMGGKIEVESELGKGTTFKIYF
jgi:PAS domain S-box-containing protein